jgi:hypothetical protein
MKTQELTIQVPKAEYAIGEFVLYEPEIVGEPQSAYIICRIEAFCSEGTWSCLDGKAVGYVESNRYSFASQEGSLTTKGTPLRPGMCLSAPAVLFEAYSKRTRPPETVWEPDTDGNLSQRLDEWENANSVL